ncbi:MAG: hypothetical protein AAF928_10440 [Myxococcota bacterium]
MSDEGHLSDATPASPPASQPVPFPPERPEGGSYLRAGRMLLAVLAVWVLLVATHRGEFWPMSIYPMFSGAGKPWVRSLVRDVTDVPNRPGLWDVGARVDDLPGKPYPLARPGRPPQNDLSGFLKLTETWDDQAQGALAGLFATAEPERRLLVYRVDGRKNEQGDVIIAFRPLALIHGGRLTPRPGDGP